MSIRTYSNSILILRNYTGMVVPRAFHSCWRLFALDQIQLNAYCTVVKRRFSVPMLTFPSVSVVYSVIFLLFYLSLCVAAQKHSRQTSCIIMQKGVICWSMGPVRWVGSKKESSWSKFVLVAIWLLLGHWILGLLGMSTRRCRSAMGSWALWRCSWFISLSFDCRSHTL